TLTAPMTKLSYISYSCFSLKGQIDYIRIYDTTSKMLYDEEFNDVHNLATYKPTCNCESSFTNYFNKKNNSSFTYARIQALFANSTGTLIQDAYKDSILGNFSDRYLAKCMSARYNESFSVLQPVSEYHYTLYYYDQAGNLIKTIPPEGVDISKFTHPTEWSDS